MKKFFTLIIPNIRIFFKFWHTSYWFYYFKFEINFDIKL